MIIGAHVIIQSSQHEHDRMFFSDVLKLPSVDAGGGFMLFGIPPAEVAVHEHSGGSHEILLMCDDVEKFIADMTRRGFATTPSQNQGWGIATQVTLPSGAKLGVYQPLHKRPKQPGAKMASAPKPKAAKRAMKGKRTAKKSRPVKQRRAKSRRR